MNLEKTYNYFYKITNKINGKFYYGIHSTNNLNDGYMGCGRDIIKAIKKYGKENFEKEIIEIYSTRKEASDKEKEVVTLELVENKMCYNLRCGGDNENILSDNTKEKIRQANLGKTGDKSSFYGKKHTEEAKEKNRQAHLGKKLTEDTKRKIGDAVRGEKNFWYGKTGKDNPLTGFTHPPEFGEQISIRQQGENNSFYGKKHTEEAKEKIREKMTGENNPFYGKSHTDETKQKLKEKSTGKKHDDKTKLKMKNNSAMAKSCKIENKYFSSLSDAAKYYNISTTSVSYRVRSDSEKWKKWILI